VIEVEVEETRWTDALPEAAAVAERAAAAALGSGKAEGAVVVLLTDDAGVKTLNARHRGRDQPTNVLSFPSADMPVPGQPRHLGDLVLAYETCAAEAEQQGKSLADHLSHLTVHGVLHLLGRDHDDDGDAEAMEAEERAVLASLGVADPYRAE
jgi:probable rRNA maturation factor